MIFIVFVCYIFFIFFFFQAEDGIRDLIVTGVQTCALPILLDLQAKEIRNNNKNSPSAEAVSHLKQLQEQKEKITDEIIASLGKYLSAEGEIGRASCRERV